MEQITVVYRDDDRGFEHLEFSGATSDLFAELGSGWFVAHERTHGEHHGYQRRPVIINGAEVRCIRQGWV